MALDGVNFLYCNMKTKLKNRFHSLPLRIVLAWMAVLLCSSLCAKPVSRSAAYRMAVQFSTTHLGQNSTAKIRLHKASVRLQGDTPAYYAFNIGTDEGFILVAGDDVAGTILGYSDHGTFDTERLPEGMKALLQTYSAQTELLRSQAVKKATVASHSAISPLITTHWNQALPYNLYCPIVGDQLERSYTGCVATAMAQIMYYHRWPLTKTKFIPAYGYLYSTSTSVKVDKAMPTTFDWDAMTTDYDEDTTTEAAKAVAKLMVYAGKSVKMQYSAYGSGTSSANIPVALKRYFGYDESVRLVNRFEYTSAGWDSLIYNEISKQRPVLLSAVAVAGSNTGGHAFVCDGYDGEGRYHINWGWGGYSDGYFKLELLDPNGQGAGGIEGGSGYSLYQDAVVGIQPGNNAQLSDNVNLTVTEFYSTDTIVHPSQGFYPVDVSGAVYNYSEKNGYFSIAHGLYSGNGTLLGVYKPYSLKLMEVGDGADVSTQLALPDTLSDGIYYLKLVCSNDEVDENNWFLPRYADVQSIKMKVENNTATLTNIGCRIAAHSMKCQGNERAESQQAVTAIIKNIGTAHTAQVYLFANGERVTASGLNIDPGDSTEMTFLWTPEQPGSYLLTLTADERGLLVSDSMRVNMSQAEAHELEGTFTIDGAFSKETNLKAVSGTCLKGTLKVRNIGATDYNDPLTLALYYVVGKVGEQTQLKYTGMNLTVERSIASGDSTTIDFNFDNLNSETSYFLVCVYKTQGQTALIKDNCLYMVGQTTNSIEGITRKDKSETVYDLKGIKIPDGQQPSGIVIKGGKKILIR